MKRFFAYCPDMGFYLFDTAEDAEAHTRRDIPEHLDECWSEEVESVCWGEVRQIAAVVSRVGPCSTPGCEHPDHPAPAAQGPCNGHHSSTYDEAVEYGLVDVEVRP